MNHLEIQPVTLVDIVKEVRYARTAFPGNKDRFAALVEEVGEVAKALLEGEGPRRVYEEAIQVAATAIRLAEEGDADYPHDPMSNARCPDCGARMKSHQSDHLCRCHLLLNCVCSICGKIDRRNEVAQ